MSPPADADPTIITPGLLRGWPVEVDEDATRQASGGKRFRGAVLVVGGARKTPGAVVLAGLAALRAGAGKLSVAVPDSTAVPIAVAVPECGATGLPETEGGAIAPEAAAVLADELSGLDAVLVGPGLADVAACCPWCPTASRWCWTRSR
jgi:ADP-dependent NAD(P)H-hydrate dehydratase